jgi:hypothetical protein
MPSNGLATQTSTLISVTSSSSSATGVSSETGGTRNGGLTRNTKGAVAGGVVGGVALLAGVGALVWILVVHMRKKRDAMEEPGRAVGANGMMEETNQIRVELDGIGRVELDGGHKFRNGR